ncbi:MAG: hypothetical protein JNL75_09945 [Chitinophagales bacterium]|nr:hypothetical protein [Chitinophagales bacterium]
MKKIYLFTLIWISNYSFGQFQEITGGLGFSYYYGDLNLRNSDNITALFGDFFEIENMKMSYSLGYRYNFQNYVSIGINLYHMNLSGYDSDNKNVGPNDNTFGRKIRNLNFHTAVNELFLDVRFEPLRTSNKWGRNKIHFSPYLGAGIGLFQFNPKSYTKAGKEVELQPLGTEGQGLPGYAQKYSLIQLVVPVNLGLRITPKSRQYSLSIDFNYNHTFTDYLDDVSTTYADPTHFRNAYQTSNPNLYNLVTEMNDKRPIAYQQPDKRGNSSDKDFFMTGQIKFSYFLFNQSINTYYKCCDY